MKKTKMIPSMQIAYVENECPNSQSILFLHALGEEKESYEEMLSFFTDCRCIAFDWPGHGESGRSERWTLDAFTEVLKDVMDYLNVDKAWIVASSFSAWVAQTFTAKYPERVAGLILLDGGYYDPSPYHLLQIPFHTPPVFPDLQSLRRNAVEYAARIERLGVHVSEQVKAFIIRTRMHLYRYLAEENAFIPKTDQNAMAALGEEIKCGRFLFHHHHDIPTLLLLADLQETPAGAASLLQHMRLEAKKESRMDVKEIPNSYYLLMLTNPEETSALIRAYLEEHRRL